MSSQTLSKDQRNAVVSILILIIVIVIGLPKPSTLLIPEVLIAYAIPDFCIPFNNFPQTTRLLGIIIASLLELPGVRCRFQLWSKEVYATAAPF